MVKAQVGHARYTLGAWLQELSEVKHKVFRIMPARAKDHCSFSYPNTGIHFDPVLFS
jgi:hypothetical protein